MIVERRDGVVKVWLENKYVMNDDEQTEIATPDLIVQEAVANAFVVEFLRGPLGPVGPMGAPGTVKFSRA